MELSTLCCLKVVQEVCKLNGRVCGKWSFSKQKNLAVERTVNTYFGFVSSLSLLVACI